MTQRGGESAESGRSAGRGATISLTHGQRRRHRDPAQARAGDRRRVRDRRAHRCRARGRPRPVASPGMDRLRWTIVMPALAVVMLGATWGSKPADPILVIAGVLLAGA